MNKIGISTASFYPALTEDALRVISSLNCRFAEMMVSSFDETQGTFWKDITSVVKSCSIEVGSFHPFSVLETNFIFSDYPRRRDYLLKVYERHFECMQEIGAKIFVFHGAVDVRIPPAQYAETLMNVSNIAKKYGVTVAIENVSYGLSGDLEFISQVADEVGKDFKMVLDIKQAVRGHSPPLDYIKRFGANIIHIHASDNIAAQSKFCLIPGQGNFNFAEMFEELNKVNAHPSVVIEVYSDAFKNANELKKGIEVLKCAAEVAIKT